MAMSFLADENAFYRQQAIDLDVGDNLLFDRLVSTGKQFELPQLWDSEDDLKIEIPTINSIGMNGCGRASSSSVKSSGKKEDFHKMLNDWEEHLSSLKALDTDKFHSQPPTLLPRPQSVSLDELFPDVTSIRIKEETTITIKEETPIRIKEEDVTNNFEIHCEESKEDGEINSDADEDHMDMNDSGLGKEREQLKQNLNLDSCKESTGEPIINNRRISGPSEALEAADVKTLLEQFEASEMFDTKVVINREQKNALSHQNIRDSLPKEVIERIKASSACKKSIAIIPAMPSKKTGRAATRMQDAAATLTRNKLLKIVSGGESVQLDHDYCSGTGSESLVAPPRNFYQSDVADYTSSTYSRLPDYYVALAPQKALDTYKTNKDWTEKNSKKDSGLESGDVSDASEEVPLPASTKNMTMVSVLKRCHVPQAASRPETESSSAPPARSEEPAPRKRKLNLEEYRSRREERERLRSEAGSRTCSPDLNAEAAPSFGTERSCRNPSSKSSDSGERLEIKMQSVQVQTMPENTGAAKESSDLSRSVPKKSSQDTSRRRREYRTRRVSSSSSSSSDSRGSRHRSHKRRKNSESRSSNSHSRTRNIWSRSRSRSTSSHSSCSTCCSTDSPSSSRSRSQSRSSRCSWSGSGSKWNGRSLWRTKHRFNRTPCRQETWRNQKNSSWSSNRSRVAPSSIQNEWGHQEKLRQVEERRVIYVGRIDEGTTKAHLRERFEVFGPIIDISVHFRERGDNYGFVTFAYKVDAYEAVEHGNDDPLLPHYDLSFGGRRAFCKQRYADLDIERNNKAYNGSLSRSDASFDLLLREAQAKLRKRSSV